MKNFPLRDQRGASLVMVLAVITIGVASISYTITDLLPKLQKEKNKVETTINYKVFIASLNDYVVHSIRERWCFNVVNGETDLLITDLCSSNDMESIVTHAGNLERVLWTADNIGSTPTSLEAARQDNRILAIHYQRIKKEPKLRKVSFSDIALPGGKLSLKVPKSALVNMTDQHPLYVMTRPVLDCINSVDINLFQVKDTNNVQAGEERKIGIMIEANITPLKIKCLAVRDVTSTSYYTFYPRKLHTFSLMKYGNLDTKLNNEFHGPVYVAGDVVLPPEDFDINSSSVFYNTVTMGVFNGGSDYGGKYRAGRIVKQDQTDYTFPDRGHPYKSKQDFYPGFKGFRGGVRLDATEDKGFFNLFSYSNSSAADMNKLKECIEEAKYQTTPSLNEKSNLAYTNYVNNGNRSSIKLSFTERNRFKTGVAPGTIKETYTKWETARSSTRDRSRDRDRDRSRDRDRNEEIVNVEILNPIEPSAELIFKVPPPPNGVLSYGEIYLYPGNESFDLSRDNHFAATIGSGSTAEVYLNYDKFNLTKTTINNFINNINSAEKDNYRNAISSSHILYLTNENINFIKKAEALRNKCDDKVSDTCEFFGYGQAECAKITTSTIKDYCNYDEEIQEFKNARQTLLTELEKVKKYVESDSPEDAPKMVVSMEDYYEKSKLVLNQKKLIVSFSDAWKFFFPILKSRVPGL